MTRQGLATAVALALTGGWLGAVVGAGPALDAASPAVRLAGAGVYVVGHRLCHQRVERSFAWRGRTLPVCGRCAGLYAAAPLGVLLAAFGPVGLVVGAPAADGRRRRWSARPLLLWAAAPTATTLVLEFVVGLPIGSLARAVAAAPIGAAVAWVVSAWLAGDLKVDGAEVN